MTDERRQVFHHDFTTRHEQRSLAKLRRNLRADGWARTSIISIHRRPSPVVGATTISLDIECSGWRGLSNGRFGSGRLQAHAATDWERSWTFTPGIRVQTLAEGLNFAAGARHVIPPGAIGFVASKQGINVRVRFTEVPGRTFVYAPAGLKIMGAGE